MASGVQYRRTFLVLILVLVLLSSICSVASGIRISGGKCVMDVEPGASAIHTIRLEVPGATGAETMTIEVMGLELLPDGRFQAVPDDGGEFSAVKYISLDKSSFTIDPGEREAVTVTIQVPKDAGAGGRYAMLCLHDAPSSGGTLSLVTGINIPVLLTLSGTDLVHTGAIRDVAVAEPESGKPFVITTTLENTGNHHYRPEGEVTITRPDGSAVSTAAMAPKTVMPGSTMNIDASVEEPLEAGSYAYDAVVRLETGEIIGEHHGTFEVNEPYVPPFKEAKATIRPGAEGIVVSPDGSPSVTFPAGAVEFEVEVTLRPYTDALPQAPPDAVLGSLAFEIAARYGILSLPATITAPYNDDDLALAGGNPAKLHLARWDGKEKSWVIYETTADPAAKTLSTTSDRLGIWTVMVVDRQAAKSAAMGASPGMPGFIGWMAVIAVMAAWAGWGRRKQS
jgi:hypothetical protein